MNTEPHRTRPLAITALAILLAVLLGLIIWQKITFRIVGINPSASTFSTVSPFFKVTFSQTLSSSGMTVTGTPSGFTGTPSVSGKVLTIPLRTPLVTGQTYTITITNIQSTHGKQITNQTYTFKPSYVPSSNLPDDQKQAILQQENIGGTANTTDPILDHLPHQTTDFRLSQDTTPQKTPPANVPLYATLTLSQADLSNQDAAVSHYKQEVLDYITSLGLDPSHYSITYTIQGS